MFPMRSLLFFIVLMSCGFNLTISKSNQPANASQSEQSKLSKICLSKTCNDTASEILNNMDPTADPCDDFYQFACGGHMKKANSTTIIAQKTKIFMDQLKKDLNGTIKEDEPRPLRMVKNYFQSCMNESAIEENSVNSLLQIIKSVGGWPIIEGEKWNESKFDWIECVIELQKMGFLIYVMPELRVEKSENNNANRTIYMILDRSEIMFLQGMNKTKDILREDVVNIAVELGANREFAEKEVWELFDFISKLNHFNDFELKKPKYVSKKFGALNDSSVEFPVKKSIEKLIQPFYNIDNDTDVFWTNSIDDLKTLMDKTSKRNQANYIIWIVILQSAGCLKKSIRQNYEKISRDARFGVSYMENFLSLSRTDECFGATIKYMTISLLALYVRKNLDKNSKEDTMEIVENIRKRILKNIDETTSTQIKDIFRNKIEKVEFFVAYDGEIFNDTKLEELDKDLNISPSNDFLQNNINLMGYTKRKLMLNLRKQDKEFLLPFFPHFLQWKPMLIPDLNTIMIPAGSFQSVTTKIDNPEYIKYGSLGSILGHELYHGIDSMNRDRDENFQKITWDNTSRKIFSRQDECLINQYSNYSVGGKKLNGRKLLRENIADNGGMKAVYLAYLNQVSKEKKPELLLPNLPYTPKQLFWISVVNNFCKKKKDPNSYNSNYPNTPLQLRFQGSFSNMPEFAKDFNCPVGSTMNPLKKCSVI